MRAAVKGTLGAALIALAGASIAQAPAPPAPTAPIQRPFGSVPLMVPPGEAPAKDCDAACLTALAQSYVDAMVRHDGSGLPWADRVSYAENGVRIMVGDGTWATITGQGEAPLIVADPKAGKVVWLGRIDDHGQPAFIAIELTARRGSIASVQSVIRHKEGRPPFGDPATYRFDTAFSAPLAKGRETPRGVMFGLVQAFFDAQSGKGAAPNFGKDCVLMENGLPMTGNLPATKPDTGACAASFARGLFQEYEGVRRRVVAYDEPRGVVVVTGARDLPAEKMEFTGTDGKAYKAESNYPRSVGFTTVFKIEAGAISRVASIANELPYLMPAPWPEPRGGRP